MDDETQPYKMCRIYENMDKICFSTTYVAFAEVDAVFTDLVR